MNWRVGRHYAIHVYEGDRPVATFFRPEDAARCVADHRGIGRALALAEAWDRKGGHWTYVEFVRALVNSSEEVTAEDGEPMCTGCGHPRSQHIWEYDQCCSGSGPTKYGCGCPGFREATT